MPLVDVVTQHARLAHANLALRRHLRQQRHFPFVFGHDAEYAGVRGEPVEELERGGRGWGDDIRDGKRAVLEEGVRVRRGGRGTDVVGPPARRGSGHVSPSPSTVSEIFLLKASDAMVHLRGRVESGDLRGGRSHQHVRLGGVAHPRDGADGQHSVLSLRRGQRSTLQNELGQLQAENLLRRDARAGRSLQLDPKVRHGGVGGHAHDVLPAPVRHAHRQFVRHVSPVVVGRE